MSGGERWAKRGCGSTVALAVVLLARAAQSAALALSYAVTVPDVVGARHDVSFQGSVDGRTLTGTVHIDGVSHDVGATIGGDFSLSGKVFGQDGKVMGLFWGRPDGRGFKGQFDLGGQVGEWSIPRVTLPALTP